MELIFPAFLLLTLLLSRNCYITLSLPGSVNSFISARTFLSKKHDVIKLTAFQTHSVDSSNEEKPKYLAAVFPRHTERDVYYSRWLFLSNLQVGNSPKESTLELNKFRMFSVTSDKIKRQGIIEISAVSCTMGWQGWSPLRWDVFSNRLRSPVLKYLHTTAC